MKKILFMMLFIMSITIYASCTKEKLVMINEELILDENSPEFQTYLAERAMGFIRMYRFEKLGNVLDKIEDPKLKTNLLDSLTKYKKEATARGLFFVTPQNDSLFFIMPSDQSPAERTSLGMVFNTSPNIINAKGILQGFKNFPKVQFLQGTNSLATGLKDLEYMPDLKEFTWIFYPEYFYDLFPDGELPIALAADLSKNSRLEKIKLEYVSMKDMIFPTHKIEELSLRDGGVINEGEDHALNRINAKSIVVGTGIESANPDLTIVNDDIDNLSFSSIDGLKTLDISRTKVQSLYLYMFPEKLTLNNGLKKLLFRANNLTQKPNFPQSLEELELSNYSLSDKDFSTLTHLKTFTLGSSGDVPPFDPSELILPQSLENYYHQSRNISILDLSYLTNLRLFSSYVSDLPGVVLPVSIAEIDISSTSKLTSLDISQFPNLDKLNITYSEDLMELILPANFNEQVMINSMKYENQKPLILKTGISIINKPSWFDQYVQYY